MRQYVNFHVVFPLVETHVRYSAASSSGKRPINKTGLDKNKRIGSGGNGASKNRRSSTPSKNNNNSAVSAIDFETECQYFQDQREGSKLYKNFRESSDPLLDLGSGGGAATGGSSVMVSTTSFVMNGPQYPINLLRNVARKRVLTDYSLVIPLYLQPSEGLRSKFHKMVKRRKDLDEKTVFVIPSFESKNNETPRNKADLLKLLHSYQARPYHFELCWKCQVRAILSIYKANVVLKSSLGATYVPIYMARTYTHRNTGNEVRNNNNIQKEENGFATKKKK